MFCSIINDLYIWLTSTEEENCPILKPHELKIEADPRLGEFLNKHCFADSTVDRNGKYIYYFKNEKSLSTQVDIFNRLTWLFNIENNSSYSFSF